MSFVENFWSPGYANGLEVLFSKLRQGVVENNEILALANARAEIEESYGQRLADLPSNHAPKKAGFAKDDGATLRTAFSGIITEMGREGKFHLQVAENIRTMVVVPFAKWSEEHASRVEYSHTTLRRKVKEYERELAEVNKSQKRYFNKCRLLEDLKDEANVVEMAPDTSVASVSSELPLDAAAASPELSNTQSPVASVSTMATTRSGDQASEYSEEGLTSEELVLNNKVYNSEEAQQLIARMLNEIPRRSLRITILGTYDNVATGSEITEWIQHNVAEAKATSAAERFGQELIDGGFLRLVGQVGSKFANSSVMQYQWRPRSFEFAGLGHHGSSALDSFSAATESWSETVTGYWRRTGIKEEDYESSEKLSREVRELDQKYRKNVAILDNVRCEVEELIVGHLQFMERCELDRLKAVKAVMLDFLAALSNSVPAIQATVDKLLVYQESANPASDLRYIVESYRTGSFLPRVTVYDNYYSSADGTIFGMDLELRCRGDRKHVPYVVSTILSHLDLIYPKLENDDVRVGLWQVSVPLKTTHELRREINTSSQFDRSILTAYEPPVVASVLKMYLLELPDSLIPARYYEVLKAIYSHSASQSGTQTEKSDARRTAVLNTLSQLRVNNIATLDALTAHLKRLLTIAKAKEADIQRIAKEVGRSILRPKVESPLTFNDTFSAQLVQDLLVDRDRLFKELKQRALQQAPTREPSLVQRRDSVEDRVARITTQLRTTDIQGDQEDVFKSPETPTIPRFAPELPKVNEPLPDDFESVQLNTPPVSEQEA